jgi:hypothetical protein
VCARRAAVTNRALKAVSIIATGNGPIARGGA